MIRAALGQMKTSLVPRRLYGTKPIDRRSPLAKATGSLVKAFTSDLRIMTERGVRTGKYSLISTPLRVCTQSNLFQSLEPFLKVRLLHKCSTSVQTPPDHPNKFQTFQEISLDISDVLLFVN